MESNFKVILGKAPDYTTFEVTYHDNHAAAYHYAMAWTEGWMQIWEWDNVEKAYTQIV